MCQSPCVRDCTTGSMIPRSSFARNSAGALPKQRGDSSRYNRSFNQPPIIRPRDGICGRTESNRRYEIFMAGDNGANHGVSCTSARCGRRSRRRAGVIPCRLIAPGVCRESVVAAIGISTARLCKARTIMEIELSSCRARARALNAGRHACAGSGGSRDGGGEAEGLGGKEDRRSHGAGDPWVVSAFRRGSAAAEQGARNSRKLKDNRAEVTPHCYWHWFQRHEWTMRIQRDSPSYFMRLPNACGFRAEREAETRRRRDRRDGSARIERGKRGGAQFGFSSACFSTFCGSCVERMAYRVVVGKGASSHTLCAQPRGRVIVIKI